MSARRLLPLVAAAALIALLAGDVLACPNCKDAVKPDNAAAAGFNNTIYLMVSTVLSGAGLLVFKIFRAVRRADSIQP